jgi:2-polyprenyl-3-methyl-5-hydroxy-6-metoxy-1,4-benzoquinol methylase
VLDEAGSSELTGAETFNLHKARYAFAAKHIAGGRILDLACGVGYGARFLKDALPQPQLVAVDLVYDTITYARRRYATDGLTFLVSNAMTFMDKPFDAIVSLETIEHLSEPDIFMRRIVTRPLRPDAVFVESVPVTPSMDANPCHLTDFHSSPVLQSAERCGAEGT